MNVDKTLILNDLMRYKNFASKAEFARFLEITPQNLSQWFKRNTFDVDIIGNKFPEINHVWLLTGEGEMLKETGNKQEDSVDLSSATSTEGVTIPLLPIYAQGGTLNDFVSSVMKQDCERIVSPINGADFAITISGDSMAPEYPSGSQVIIKKINERAFIDWGRVYVLDTCNGVVVKRLMPAEDVSKVKCVSINPEFPPFEVSLQDIYGIYRVMLCMAMK